MLKPHLGSTPRHRTSQPGMPEAACPVGAETSSGPVTCGFAERRSRRGRTSKNCAISPNSPAAHVLDSSVFAAQEWAAPTGPRKLGADGRHREIQITSARPQVTGRTSFRHPQAQVAVATDSRTQTRSHCTRDHARTHVHAEPLSRSYELGVEARTHGRVAAAFTELAQTI